MNFTITNTEEKIQTIRLLREIFGTGLGESKEYAEGQTFVVPEYHNNCAEVYLDLLATRAAVQTERPLQQWQFEKAVEDAEQLQHRLANRVFQARKQLARKPCPIHYCRSAHGRLVVASVSQEGVKTMLDNKLQVYQDPITRGLFTVKRTERDKVILGGGDGYFDDAITSLMRYTVSKEYFSHFIPIDRDSPTLEIDKSISTGSHKTLKVKGWDCINNDYISRHVSGSKELVYLKETLELIRANNS